MSPLCSAMIPSPGFGVGLARMTAHLPPCSPRSGIQLGLDGLGEDKAPLTNNVRLQRSLLYDSLTTLPGAANSALWVRTQAMGRQVTNKRVGMEREPVSCEGHLPAVSRAPEGHLDLEFLVQICLRLRDFG